MDLEEDQQEEEKIMNKLQDLVEPREDRDLMDFPIPNQQTEEKDIPNTLVSLERKNSRGSNELTITIRNIKLTGISPENPVFKGTKKPKTKVQIFFQEKEGKARLKEAKITKSTQGFNPTFSGPIQMLTNFHEMEEDEQWLFFLLLSEKKGFSRGGFVMVSELVKQRAKKVFTMPLNKLKWTKGRATCFDDNMDDVPCELEAEIEIQKGGEKKSEERNLLKSIPEGLHSFKLFTKGGVEPQMTTVELQRLLLEATSWCNEVLDLVQEIQYSTNSLFMPTTGKFNLHVVVKYVKAKPRTKILKERSKSIKKKRTKSINNNGDKE